MANDGHVVVKIDGDDSGYRKAINGIGGLAKKAAGVAVKGVAAAASAITALTGMAIKNYAEYEQLVGGVETLFKSASDTVMENAKNAYKTAGMAANEYMELTTGFAASLKQSFDDTADGLEQAADVADMAVTDMADNSNKMGTSIESIKTAYQGFAKQNYTMLDNLKLGYGGTKEEMERLLADAEKISGIKYDISNLADVYNAIHVIQTDLEISGYSADELKEKLSNMSLTTDEVKRIAEDMGITYEEAMSRMKDGTLTVNDAQVLLGTTAKEASTTIQGSAASMKAAWSNLVTGIADDNADVGQLIDNLIESAMAFGDNILPRIEIALQGVGDFISAAAEKLLPKVIDIILSNLPQLLTVAVQLVESLANTLISNLPTILNVGVQIIFQLVHGIAQQLPSLIPAAVEIVFNLVDTLLDNIDMLIDAAIEFITALAEGLINALPILIEKIPEIVSKLAEAFARNAPKIAEAAGKLIEALVSGLIKSIPALLKAVPVLISALYKNFITEIKLIQEVGINIVKGIWRGISDGTSWIIGKIKEWCGNVLDKIKSFFGIHSPSKVMRDQVGKMITKGIAVGINDGKTEVEKVMDEMNKKLLDSEQKYLDESERLKDSKSEADKKYLEELKKASETERKIYDALQKDIENNKKSIVESFKTMADGVFDSISDIEKAEENLSNKLKSFGSMFEKGKKTVSIDGLTIERDIVELSDIEAQNNTLKDYAAALKTLEKRGVSKEFFSEMRDLSVDDGLLFAEKLLSLSAEEYEEYMRQWEDKQNLSDVIAKELFGTDTDELRKQFEAEWGELPEGFFDIGEEAAQTFGEGFMEQLKTTFESAKNMIIEGFGNLSVNVDGGGGSTTYNINLSNGESTRSALSALRQQELLKEMRGAYT